MQKRWSRIFALTLGIPVLLSILVACGAGTTGTTTGNATTVTVKIGSEFPTTGDDTSSGLPAQNGVDFAVKEANSKNLVPGVKFVLDPKDDVGSAGHHDATVGQKNVTDLIGDAQVAGIVGPLNSSVAQSEMPVANQAPIALISPSNSNDCLTQNTPDFECGGSNSLVTQLRPTSKVTYFRTATLDQYQGAALAEYGYKTKGYKKVYVIDDTEAYGAGLAKNFVSSWKKLGGTVIDQRSIAKTNSYESLLATIAATKPDVIFFGGNDSTGAITVRQQMQANPDLASTPFIVGDGSKTSSLAKDIIPLKGGAVFGSVPGVDASQVTAAKDFLDKYQKQFGNPGAYSGGGYDDAMIVIKAVKAAIAKGATAPTDSNDTAHATTFRQAVIDAMKTIEYDGITGHQAFDANGDTKNKTISVYTLGDANVGDGWKYLASVSPSS